MNTEQQRIELANKWCADKCGVELWTNLYGYSGYKYKGQNRGHPFTIEDPRCREIVRERFKIRTVWNISDNIWKAYTFTPFAEPNGETIAEAEIACILSIVEQEEG